MKIMQTDSGHIGAHKTGLMRQCESNATARALSQSNPVQARVLD